FVKVLQAFMSADINKAAVDGKLKPHRFDRGLKWVLAALESPHPAQRAKVGDPGAEHEVVVRQVKLQGIPLPGVLTFGVRDPRSVPNLVVYTPDAPDGVAFREGDNAADLFKEMMNVPGMKDYLASRTYLGN